jgi:hypothetical protein
MFISGELIGGIVRHIVLSGKKKMLALSALTTLQLTNMPRQDGNHISFGI